MARWKRFEVVDEHIMTALKTMKERRQEGKNWICDLRWCQRSAGDILSVLSQERNHKKQLASFKYEQLFDVDVIKGATGNLTRKST
jgi:hypothetical protein